MIKALNLYAGLGGNRKKWDGVQVTAVEQNACCANFYKKLFPADTVIIGDAREYLLLHYNEFDFIWSSPPCKWNSFMRRYNPQAKPKFPDLKLYEEVVFLSSYFKGKYVVENVEPYYDPLLQPQRVARHLFWSNFIIHPFRQAVPPNIIEDATSIEGRNTLAAWLGIDYDFSVVLAEGHPEQALKNCVHPDLGLHVFRAAYSGQQMLEL